jgi:hypothetical protein
LVWAQGPLDRARKAERAGATLLAWNAPAAAELLRAQVPFRDGTDLLAGEPAEAAVKTWTRVWGRLPLLDGRSFRELAEWKGDSLWWMGEAFFRSATLAPRCVRLAETFLRLLESEDPAEVEPAGLDADEAALLSRAATVRGVLYHGPENARPRQRPSAWASRGRREAWAAWARGFHPRRVAAPPVPLAIVVGLGAEDAAAPLVAGLAGDGHRVPLADLRDAASRRALKEAGTARRELGDLWQRLRRSPGVNESFTHRGVPFGDLAEADLAGLLLFHLPAAVRLYEAAREWLLEARPTALVLLVPSRDDRRTLLAAARATAVRSVVWRPAETDEPDRADGGPQPDHAFSGEGATGPERLRALIGAEAPASAAAHGRVEAP